ncbi:MAG: glycosyltransferase family 2 protein [Lachnospiraceae bacterium]|nr:glycosyltransferase family 2 protein [Lachnospiraceae bacterium]
MNSVTVVIPVYRDWATLSGCMESLKKYLNRKHKVILVNDKGPEWEKLEKNILIAIQDDPRFFYKRNASNEGFVRTCNKAVLEWDKSDNDVLLLNSDTEVTEGFLEEMQRILHMDRKTAVVCPRSNNATFLSVPVNSNGRYVSAEDSYRIYGRIKEFLPEKEECWTGVGFAFLIKRHVIHEIGLFDESFGKGYNEENDFCMRARKQNYQVMKANYAYVFHWGRISFQSEADELELRNSSLLLKRYPCYWDKVEEYRKKIDVIDYFADILTGVIYDHKRILIAFPKEMTKQSLLEKIHQCQTSKELNQCDYVIVTNENNEKKIRKHVAGGRVYSIKRLDGTFHMAYSLSEPDEEWKVFLDRHSLFTLIVDDFSRLNIEEEIKRRGKLNDLNVDSLRKRWEKLLPDAKDSQKIRGRKKLIKKIKTYLYMHHIWIYVLWHRIRSKYGR